MFALTLYSDTTWRPADSAVEGWTAPPRCHGQLSTSVLVTGEPGQGALEIVPENVEESTTALRTSESAAAATDVGSATTAPAPPAPRKRVSRRTTKAAVEPAASLDAVEPAALLETASPAAADPTGSEPEQLSLIDAPKTPVKRVRKPRAKKTEGTDSDPDPAAAPAELTETAAASASSGEPELDPAGVEPPADLLPDDLAAAVSLEETDAPTDHEAEPPLPAKRRRRRSKAAAAMAAEDAQDDIELDPGPPGEVQLQASWVSGRLVIWAGGPGCRPETNDELATRLESIAGPPEGWSVHPDVELAGNHRAEALAIGVRDALGWLIALAGGVGTDGVGDSVMWLARVAHMGVRLVAKGSIAPTVRRQNPPDTSPTRIAVNWVPALYSDGEISALASAMPGPITAVQRNDSRSITLAVLGAVVDTIVTGAASRIEFPAPPPRTKTPTEVAESVSSRLDGTPFTVPTAVGGQLTQRLEQWTRTITSPNRPRLVIQLDPPDLRDAWFLSVLGPGADGRLLPIELALTDSPNTRRLADELVRLERMFPVLKRPGELRRGQVVLSQDEAWEFMTVIGRDLETAGFIVRVPSLSRRRPKPVLQLFTERTGESVVGAHQLSDVRWSVLFDDVELSAADIARLAADARPLVRSRGRWIELDRVDLKEAAAALAERANVNRLTGAEILRFGMGVEGAGLSGGVAVGGSSWASELMARAREATLEPETKPEGFVGELRSYQAEALAWLGFLDSAQLGGCLALDMGLGKTPTVLAHLTSHRSPIEGPALVVAPPAVVGNWAAEAARFTPGLRVVVHHGASRSSAAQLERAISAADLVITTYGTAVRDMEAISARMWSRLILDEAQAIKNPASETAQQLRRIPAGTRVALTGTPIENGLGDLWAILDFTNPGLVGPRPTFVAQLAGDKDAALRALNGMLVFRRTKTEPEVAAELPDRIDELDHCTMTPEQIGLYQAVLDQLLTRPNEADSSMQQGAILAAITALKQICNHPAAYLDDGKPLAGRSGKLDRLEEIVKAVFESGEKVLIFTHFASWGRRLAEYLSEVMDTKITCYDGSLARGARDRMVADFQKADGPGALVLSLKAGGTGLNLTAASHVVLYDRWWNPAVEDQARDRAWRIGQTRTVISHRFVCPGTVDERVEEVVSGKRHIAGLVLPRASSLADLDAEQLRVALGLRPESVLTDDTPSVGA